jgi:hypothetical protein
VPQAVKGVLTDKWPAAKDYAESEGKKLAETLAMIESPACRAKSPRRRPNCNEWSGKGRGLLLVFLLRVFVDFVLS